MSDREVPERAAEFLESYRAAFERFDSDGIADHFTYPALMIGDAAGIEVTPIPVRDRWRAELEHLLSAYRSVGMRSAEILRLTATAMSPRVLQAWVDWRLRDGSGAELYDFHAAYTLVEIGDRLRIAVIAHDEIPRLRRLLGRQN